MTSRLRKTDVPKQETIDFDDEQPIDIQDQTELIDTLATSNEETFKRYTRYLSVFYIAQIYLMLSLQLSIGTLDPPYLLFTLAVVFNLISINFAQSNIALTVANALVSLQLSYVGYCVRPEELPLLCIMPWFNMATPYVFKYWFTSMNELVEELNKLKYEYKSV
ncbi:hypothetical protein Cantr_03302 [Candida viswanathii]|uniref:Uncharacterized protein n=1 Tax=Candida viswanathii TaxID=5486 RepID=A0A367YPR9_9ASCO|nr:hypothetical protein Cantr_03302 [Candida viswanathii]